MTLMTWHRNLAVGIVLGCLYLAAPSPVGREVAWLFILALTCLSVRAGIRRNRPRVAWPWWVIGTGFALMLLGNLLRLLLGAGPALDLAGQVVVFAAYPLLAVAALGLVRAQAPGGDREGAIDGTMVMIALATALSGTVFAPDAFGQDSTTLGFVLFLGPPLLVAGVIAATLRLLFVGGSRVASTWLIVGSGVSGLTGNVLRTVLSASGAYERGSWPDVLLVAACLCVAVAVLHPSMVLLTEPAPATERRLTHARLVVLGVALMAAPATLLLSRDSGPSSVPVVASLALNLLVLWRLGALVVEREAVRCALQARAARQEALALIGRHALGDEDLSSLFSEATSVAASLLDLERCEVVVGRVPVPAEGTPTLTLPLGDAHHTYGVLVASCSGGWSAEDRAFLQAVANVLSGAVERDRTQRLMRHQALHDPLTALPNRSQLHDRLAHSLQVAAGSGRTVAVLFVDLDGFKGVNDRFGHKTGDEVLVAVSRRLRKAVRPGDMLARLAGDEFVVVCEDVDRAGAKAVAERVVEVLVEPFAVRRGRVLLGASVGVALGDGSGDGETLLCEADHAMYEAKARPGSSVVVAGCPLAPADTAGLDGAEEPAGLGDGGRPTVRSGVVSLPHEES